MIPFCFCISPDRARFPTRIKTLYSQPAIKGEFYRGTTFFHRDSPVSPCPVTRTDGTAYPPALRQSGSKATFQRPCSGPAFQPVDSPLWGSGALYSSFSLPLQYKSCFMIKRKRGNVKLNFSKQKKPPAAASFLPNRACIYFRQSPYITSAINQVMTEHPV